MNLKTIKRVNNLEFRWSKTNNSYELVRWFQRGEKKSDYCIVICFFDKHKEGYNMRTVGERYITALEDYWDTAKPLTRYAFDYLQAEFDLEERLDEVADVKLTDGTLV